MTAIEFKRIVIVFLKYHDSKSDVQNITETAKWQILDWNWKNIYQKLNTVIGYICKPNVNIKTLVNLISKAYIQCTHLLYSLIGIGMADKSHSLHTARLPLLYAPVLIDMYRYNFVFATYAVAIETSVTIHFALLLFEISIESVTTTTMENVSTGVLNKKKEHYFRCTHKAKNHMMY